MPPLDIAGYAQAHDDAVWETLQACLGGVSSGEADDARTLATLAASLGGLGVLKAGRSVHPGEQSRMRWPAPGN